MHSSAVPALADALVKPDQGGSGARIQVVESLAQVEAIFAADPSLSLPDNLFLLQEDLYAGSRSGQCLSLALTLTGIAAGRGGRRSPGLR